MTFFIQTSPPFPLQRRGVTNLKKILIIRFSSIGDIVLTTPVIRCIKEQQPDIEIHYVTKKMFKGILEYNPYITKIHTIEKNISEVIADLKKENFDFVVDLNNNIRSLQIKRLLGKPSSTFKKLNFKKWILVNFKILFGARSAFGFQVRIAAIPLERLGAIHIFQQPVVHDVLAEAVRLQVPLQPVEGGFQVTVGATEAAVEGR